MWYVFKILSDLHYSFNFSFSLTDDFNCVLALILKFKIIYKTYLQCISDSILNVCLCIGCKELKPTFSCVYVKQIIL